MKARIAVWRRRIWKNTEVVLIEMDLEVNLG